MLMLAYRLVFHGIGGRTVRELVEGAGAADEGMDFDEFLTWAAFLALEPPVGVRVDMQTAMLMAQVYNLNRKKGRPAKRVQEFLLRWYTPPKPESDWRELKRRAQLQFVAMNGNPNEIDGTPTNVRDARSAGG